jgi:hypothetical protein
MLDLGAQIVGYSSRNEAVEGEFYLTRTTANPSANVRSHTRLFENGHGSTAKSD